VTAVLASFVAEWLQRAKPGQAVIYHRGELACDKQTDAILRQVADRVLAVSTGRFDLLSRCGHIRGELVGTGEFEITSRPGHGERLYIARRLK
jgi:hypothetical protein